MHCFTEDWSVAQAALEVGFYLSFSGIVTFKNAKVVKGCCATCASGADFGGNRFPYLAPVPYRGKPNQPAHVRYVAEEVASLRGDSWKPSPQRRPPIFSDFFHGPAPTDPMIR